MGFVRAKEIPPGSGNWYDYEVENHREGDKVVQKVIRYIGRSGGSGMGSGLGTTPSNTSLSADKPTTGQQPETRTVLGTTQTNVPSPELLVTKPSNTALGTTIETKAEAHTPKGTPLSMLLSYSWGQNHAEVEVSERKIPLSIHMGGLLSPLSPAQEKQMGILGGQMLISFDRKTAIALNPDQAQVISKAWEEHQAKVAKRPEEVERKLISERDSLKDNISGILDEIKYKREQAFNRDTGNIPDYDSPAYRAAVQKLKEWDEAHPAIVEKLKQDQKESIEKHQWD